MQQLSGNTNALSVVLLWGFLSLANAHEKYEMNRSMEETSVTMPSSEPVRSQTYFHHDAYAGSMTAHIILMTIGWVFMLPIGDLLK
jgi:hypothetical protein